MQLLITWTFHPNPPNLYHNHPLIEPLSIIDSKLDSTISPLALLVLVQWHGLALEDTPWEKWDDLRLTFHLEDKVLSPVVRDDNEHKEQHMVHPKKIMHGPKALKEYIAM